MYFEFVEFEKNLKLKNIFKNGKIDFCYFDLKFRNSEISAVLYLVVPNVDPHPYSKTSSNWYPTFT